MESTEDIPISIETIHQRVGRNLILFQKLEYILKKIVAKSEVSGYASEISKNWEQRNAYVMKQTLGSLVGHHVRSLNPKQTDLNESLPESDECYFSIRYSIEYGNPDLLEDRKTVLAVFVKERNDLVHHLFANYNLNDVDSRRELAVMLDEQHQRLSQEVDFSFEQLKHFHAMGLEMDAILSSEEGRKIMFSGLIKPEESNG